MGVINITPDSFSDGGLYVDSEEAYIKAKKCVEDGSDIIDIGAQSTRPGAEFITDDLEIKRLLPSLKIIRNGMPNQIISVDTFHSKVALKALEEGANLINDVSGGRFDKNMTKVIAESGCPYVITHSRGNSKTMLDLAKYNDVVNEVLDELLILTDRALKNGIKEGQIIWDPGLGFAKTNEQNLTIIRNLERFTSEKFPVLLGPSRKKFIGYVLNEDDPKKRLLGTAAVVCRCVDAKVDIVRVHDIKEISKVLLMANNIWKT